MTLQYLSFKKRYMHKQSMIACKKVETTWIVQTWSSRGMKVSISRIWADSSIRMLSYCKYNTIHLISLQIQYNPSSYTTSRTHHITLQILSNTSYHTTNLTHHVIQEIQYNTSSYTTHYITTNRIIMYYEYNTMHHIIIHCKYHSS